MHCMDLYHLYIFCFKICYSLETIFTLFGIKQGKFIFHICKGTNKKREQIGESCRTEEFKISHQPRKKSETQQWLCPL